MQEREILLHLSLISGIGPQTVKRLQECVAPLSALYSMSAQEIVANCRLSPAQAAQLVAGLQDQVQLDRELKLIDRHEIFWYTIADTEYPAALRAIHAPPTVLYSTTPLKLKLENSLSLVGSRQADIYISKILDTWIPELQARYALISGGALGADTMVHEKAVIAQGQTIAVLGSGLLKLYPQRNNQLFQKITGAGGAVVSPFPLEMAARPENFPARNRIIAGLSKATIVLQAAQKSGALITAAFARDEGREVGAVPGLVDNPLSAGCHKLIKEGAVVITCVQDILELMGHVGSTLHFPSSSLGINSLNFGENEPLAIIRDPLLELCRSPKEFDDLMFESGFEYSQLQQKLLEFQLEGKLEQDMVGRWYAS